MADIITILVNGVPFEGWLVFKSHHSFDKAAGTLDLTIAPQPGKQLPIKIGDKIQAFVAGTSVLKGNVHDVEGNDDWQHDVRIVHARDQTQDFIDSTCGPQKPVKPPAGLKDILTSHLGNMGLGHIPVIDNVNPEQFRDGEVPVAWIDEFGHQFGDRLSRQRQVLLNTDGNGSLVIDRNQGKRGSGALFRAAPEDPRNAANNILKAHYKCGDLNRHNQHATNSQHSTNDTDYWEGKPKDYKPAQAGPLSKEYGVAYDDGVRPERRLHVRAKHSLRRGKTKDASKWRANVSKGRGFNYKCTVQGFEQAPGAIWWPGLIIPVYDYKYELDGEFLIKDVSFHRDWKGGSMTELTLTYPDAFSDKDGKGSAKTGRTSSQGAGAPDAQGEAPAGDLEQEEP